MEQNQCAICLKVISQGTSNVPFYFCTGCYETHRAAIDANDPWLRYLLNQEKQRRKRRNRRLKAASKGQLWLES
jgi:hypothetical protein